MGCEKMSNDLGKLVLGIIAASGIAFSSSSCEGHKSGSSSYSGSSGSSYSSSDRGSRSDRDYGSRESASSSSERGGGKMVCKDK